MHKQASRFQRRRTEKYNVRGEFEDLACLAINNANTRYAARLGIEDEAVHDAVRAQGHSASFFRSGKGRIDAVEVGARDAAAFAWPAVVTGHAAVMLACEDRGTADRHAPLVTKIFLHGVFHVQLGAIHLHGRKEFAVGKLGKSLGLARDAYELLDVVVPRLDVAVANRPIDSDPVASVGFKVEIAPPITLAPPHDGAATDLASANPAIWLVRR